jgi:hypothetical protein
LYTGDSWLLKTRAHPQVCAMGEAIFSQLSHLRAKGNQVPSGGLQPSCRKQVEEGVRLSRQPKAHDLNPVSTLGPPHALLLGQIHQCSHSTLPKQRLLPPARYSIHSISTPSAQNQTQQPLFRSRITTAHSIPEPKHQMDLRHSNAWRDLSMIHSRPTHCQPFLRETRR